MLSTAAWNAFLKTLEEPPPHVKFIFATTEVHKVPVTILSRCQRYDFKLIEAQTIAARLRWVLDQEKVSADDAALKIIAREAAGSMRDAMSLLDQVIAWVGVEGDRLTAEGVAKVLGVAESTVLHRLAEGVLTGDAAACVRIVGDLAQQGYDIPHTARDILAHLRDLVVAKVADDPSRLLDLADEELADVKALAARSSVDDLTRLHQGFSRAFDDIVRSGQPRASLEMALVRLARRPPLLPVDELLRRLADLERRLGGGAGPGPGPGGVGPRGGAPNPGGPAPARRPGASLAPEEAPAPPRVAPRAHEASSPSPRPAAPSAPSFPVAAPAPVARASSSPPPIPTPVPASVPAPPAELERWRSVLALVRAKRPALASVLEHAVLMRFGPDRVELGYEARSFLSGQATDPAAKDLLASALLAHFGSMPELVFETVSGRAGNVTVAMVDSAERRIRLDAAKRAVAEHPLVTAAIELLGAELRDVRLAEAEA